MSLVWMRSDDDFSNAQLFPVPVAGAVYSNYDTSLQLDCVNHGLVGAQTLVDNDLFEYCVDNPDETITFSIVYTNPLTGEFHETSATFMSGVVVDALQNPKSIFERGLQPIIRFNFLG